MTTLVAPLPGNGALAAGIAAEGEFELVNIETRRFPDGEAYVRIRFDPAGRRVALVCSLNDPDPKLMTLLLSAATARELGATQVGLVAPYLAYMRQDRRFQEGEPLSAVHFARLLSGAFDWIATVDPHLHRIRALDQVFSVPTEALHAGPVLAKWIQANIASPLLIGPDAESEQWVAAAAKDADAPYVVAWKTRHGDRDVQVEIPDLTTWNARTPVLVDDVISSGQTLLASARILRARGMRKPAIAVVHGIFADGVFPKLAAACDPIATANTIEHETNHIDIAHSLAGAVSRLAEAQ